MLSVVGKEFSCSPDSLNDVRTNSCADKSDDFTAVPMTVRFSANDLSSVLEHDAKRM
jgi:hypothetical protein